MPEATALDTPPLTAPTSPTSPTSAVLSGGDSITNFGSDEKRDPEKCNDVNNDWDPRHTTWDEHNATQQEDPKAGGLRRKLSSCLQRLTLTSAPPTIPAKHRPSDGRPKLVQRIDDHPTGYPQLAAFVNSDGNFFICRKYGFLRNRVLLYRQDELSCLEKELIALDQDNSKRRPFALTSRKHDEETDDDPNYSYKAVMQKIDNKLKEYDELVSRIQTYVALRSPTRRNVNSFIHWIRDYKPLTKEESTFLEHRDDFVALSDGQECGWLDGVVEDTLNFCLPQNMMKKLFASKEQTRKTDDDHLHLVSKRRVDVLVRLVLVLTTVGLLVGPSAVLFLVTGHDTFKICLIMGFILLFSAALSVATKAKRHEMLAATAT